MSDPIGNGPGWFLHILSDHYFAAEWLSNNKVHIYTFGDRCQPIKKQVCASLADAKIWVATFGDRLRK